jgi:hypothetical protein
MRAVSGDDEVWKSVSLTGFKSTPQKHLNQSHNPFLTEFDQEFFLSTICRQNAEFTASVFVGEDTASVPRVTFEDPSDLSAYLATPGDHWDEAALIYLALPWLKPAQAGGEFPFFYNGHELAVQQFPRGSGHPTEPTFLVYEAFANHHRIHDWLVPGVIDSEFAGSSLITLSSFLSVYLNLTQSWLDSVRALRWSREADYAHARLYGVFKFGDMERTARRPFGTLEAAGGVRLQPTGEGPYKIRIYRYKVEPGTCQRMRGSFLRRTRRASEKPIRPLSWDCKSTRWYHRECDGRTAK